MGSTLKSRAPLVMRLIACFDALPDEPMAHLLTASISSIDALRTLSDQALVEHVERYVVHRKNAPK